MSTDSELEALARELESMCRGYIIVDDALKMARHVLARERRLRELLQRTSFFLMDAEPNMAYQGTAIENWCVERDDFLKKVRAALANSSGEEREHE